MAAEQRQFYCNICGQQKLFSRNTREVNHGLHLALTVLSGLLTSCFCWIGAALWLVVWLLDTVMADIENRQVPFRCTHCGGEAGQQTSEQTARARQTQREFDAREAERRNIAWRKRGEQMARLAEGTKDISGRGIKATLREIVALPGRADRILRIVAGEGNDIVYRFLQILVFLAMLAGGTFVVWLLANQPP